MNYPIIVHGSKKVLLAVVLLMGGSFLQSGNAYCLPPLTIAQRENLLRCALAEENNISKDKICINGVAISFSDDVIAPKLKSIHKIYRDDACVLKISSAPFDIMELIEINEMYMLTINKTNGKGDFDFSKMNCFKKIKILFLNGVSRKELESLPRLSSLQGIALSTRSACFLQKNFFDRFPNLKSIRVQNIILQNPIPRTDDFQLYGTDSMSSLKYGFAKDGDRLTLCLGTVVLDDSSIECLSRCCYLMFQNCDIFIDCFSGKIPKVETEVLDCRIINPHGTTKNVESYSGDLSGLLLSE